jgi:FKBP-type peptidyl-prolyl cis-trans isomerase
VSALSIAGLALAASTVSARQARPALGETVTNASGLSYQFTKLGTGPQPKTGDLMLIHGNGKFTDGKEFWNTRTENAPYEYTLGVDSVSCAPVIGVRRLRSRLMCRREGGQYGLSARARRS